MRRSLVVIALAALAFATVALGGGALKRYHSKVLTFPYPATWTARHGKPIVGHAANLAFVSTLRIHQPCIHVRQGGRFTGWACHFPIKRLRPGSAIAWWNFISLTGISVAKQQGHPARISGRQAKIQIARSTSGDLCSLRAQEDIHVFVAGRRPGTLFKFDACLRGPGLKKLEKQAKMILFSTKILKG